MINLRLRIPVVFALAASVAGCSLETTANIPPAVSVEEQQWAPGLNVDLATMTELNGTRLEPTVPLDH